MSQIAKNVKILCETIDKELLIRDNTIRSLREDVIFRDSIIEQLLNKCGLDKNWNKL